MNKQDLLYKIEELKEQLKEIEKQERSNGFLKLLMLVLLDEESKIVLKGHEEWQFTEKYLIKDISREYRVEIAKFLKTLIKKEERE